jgi:drug/metabolite transporter (DMT)-like permease
MLIVALGLSSAIAWGLADFLGGFKNRELDIWVVGLASQLAALLICVPVLVTAGGPVPEDRVLVYGLLAGVANALGLITFYRALALGRMSIVAPIVGMSALLPVVTGLISGERPSLLQSTGIAIGIAGIVLASRELDHEVAERTSSSRVILLSIVAATAVGANLIGIEKAVALSDETSVLWPIAAARASAVVLIFAGAVATGHLRAPGARHVPALIALGALDLVANVFYAHATQETLLSVAAVLASLHPVVTILMARLLLDERLRRIQQVGVVLAIAGVCLIAGG